MEAKPKDFDLQTIIGNEMFGARHLACFIYNVCVI